MKPQRIEISYKTIIFTFLFAISLLIVWNLKSLIMLLFVCFMFMEAINPTVVKLEKMKIPRTISILLIYLLIISTISFSLASIIPIFVEQTSALIGVLPTTLENFNIFGINAIDLSSQFKLLESLPGEITRTVLSIFSNFITIIFVFVITFYLLHERKNLDKYSLKAFGGQGRDKVIKIITRLETGLGNWVIGELILMIIIGILSYVAYSLLGLSYSVPLAIIAGLFEIVPNIGPIFTTAIAAIVGLTISPFTAVMAILAGMFVHQAENNFITPKVMKETVGLNPIITIIVIAIGAKLGGIVGAALGVPIYLTISVIISVLTEKK
jgi:predicted PurR-regulated permease PerM